MPRIRVKEGDRESVHDLADGVLTVGRSPDNHVVLTDRECSRHHCYVERVDLGFKMVDLESRNGTKANGRVMNQHLLKTGDVVSIGKAEMRYEDDGRADVRVPARAASPADRGTKPAPRPAAATGRAERPRRTYARRGGDATKWVFLGVLLVAGGIAAFAISRFAAVDPELKQGRDLMVRAQAAERKADSLADPGDQARQLEAALELYRQIPESAASPFAAARQKIPALESLLREKQAEAQPRRPPEDRPPDAPRRDGANSGGGADPWDTVQRAVDRHLQDNDYKEAWIALRRFLDGNAGHEPARQRLDAVEGQARAYASTIRAKIRELVEAGRAGAAREEGHRAIDLLSSPPVTVFDDLRRQIEEDLQKLIPP